MPDIGYERARIDFRLLRIELPDVKVHNKGLVMLSVPMFDRMFEKSVGELPVVVATGDGQRIACESPGRQREFP